MGKSALHKAVDCLSRREHSLKELRWKLRAYPQDEVDAALSKLIEQDLQSDSRFASQYIQSCVERGQGPRKIAAQLQHKGIAAFVVEEQLHQDQWDWSALIMAVYKKKYQGQPIASAADRSKRSRFLYQRGFSTQHIQAVLD